MLACSSCGAQHARADLGVDTMRHWAAGALRQVALWRQLALLTGLLAFCRSGRLAKAGAPRKASAAVAVSGAAAAAAAAAAAGSAAARLAPLGSPASSTWTTRRS